jgi:hypothetical protein
MARLTPDGNTVRVVDFHTNCSCGRDVHVVADAVRVGDTSVAALTVRAAAAVSYQVYLELVAADDDEAINDEAEADESDELEPVATSAPATQAPAQAKPRPRPRAGGGG